MANYTLLVNKNGDPSPLEPGDTPVDTAGNPIGQTQPKATHKAHFVITSNVADIAAGFPSTADGYSIQDGDIGLLVGQTDASENGLYVVDDAGTGSDGSASRHPDMDTDAEVNATVLVQILRGSVYNDRLFQLDSIGGLTIGSSNLNFVKVKDIRERTPAEGSLLLDGLANLSSALVGTFTAPKSGYIVSLSANVNVTRSAGSISAQPHVNGSGLAGTALDVAINGTTTTKAHASTPYGTTGYAFAAGDTVGAMVDSSSFGPTPARLRTRLEVVYDD